MNNTSISYPDSVQLSDLPRTGFDYGVFWNNAFWIALVIWSLIIAKLVLFLKPTFIKMIAVFAGSLKRGSRQPITSLQEPVILHETTRLHNAEYDDEIVYDHKTPETIYHSQPVSSALSHNGVYHGEHNLIQDEDTTHFIKQIVNEEIKKSRGDDDASDEFTENDFEYVDFDGHNPDDDWQPRSAVESDEKIEIIRAKKVSEKADEALRKIRKMREGVIHNININNHKFEAVTQNSIKSLNIHRDEVVNNNTENAKNEESYSTRQLMIDDENVLPAGDVVDIPIVEQTTEVYSDNLHIDTSKAYPKIILTREVVEEVS
jgi:hypothetical protein